MKRTTICLLLLAAVIGSCSKSHDESELTAPQQKLTSLKAKTFYDNSLRFMTKGDVNEDSIFVPILYTPHWNDAAESFNKILEAVEVPVSSTKSYVAVIENQVVPIEQRLLIVDGEKFKSITSYMMTIVPHPDYFKSHEGLIPKITHAGEKYGFSGHIMFHSACGELIAIESYKNGSVTSRLYIPRITNFNMLSLVQAYTQIMSGVVLYHRGGVMTKTQDNGEPTYDGGSIDMVYIFGTGGNNSGIKWNSNDMLNDAMDQYFYVDPSAYESDGGGGGIPDMLWPEGVHNSIISVALRQLTRSQITLIQEGSIEADRLQGVEYNHIHAQRGAMEDKTQAVLKIRSYFTMNAMQFLRNNDYVSLGKALHPIMDAYSPPHQGFSVYNDYSYMIKHWSEISSSLTEFLYPGQISSAEKAVNAVFNQLKNLPSNLSYTDIDNVFNNWLGGYLNYLDN